MNLVIWGLLIAVAVSDAKEHRIPNLLLILILFVSAVQKLLIHSDYSLLLWSLVSGGVCFVVALLFYFLRVMAPGDVKLLGVVGFWLGSENTWGAVFWIAIASVVVGLFYAALNRIRTGASVKDLMTKYSLLVAYGSQTNAIVAGKGALEHKLRMPFAPVVVIGLALFYYF